MRRLWEIVVPILTLVGGAVVVMWAWNAWGPAGDGG